MLPSWGQERIHYISSRQAAILARKKKKKEDWNTYEVLAVGHKIQTAINGRKCVDLDDPKGDLTGHIAVQVHAGGPTEVRYKDFQLELNPEPKLKTGTQ